MSIPSLHDLRIIVRKSIVDSDFKQPQYYWEILTEDGRSYSNVGKLVINKEACLNKSECIEDLISFLNRFFKEVE